VERSVQGCAQTAAARLVPGKVAAVRNAQVFVPMVGRTTVDSPTDDPITVDSPIVDRMAIAFRIVGRTGPAKAAPASVGIVMTGAIGRTTIGLIESRIVIDGIAGATEIVTTFGTIGTIIGTITMIGTTAIGGIDTTSIGGMRPTSITGVWLRGRV
jgi:hypothetical protein